MAGVVGVPERSEAPHPRLGAPAQNTRARTVAHVTSSMKGGGTSVHQGEEQPSDIKPLKEREDRLFAGSHSPRPQRRVDGAERTPEGRLGWTWGKM